MLTSHRKPVRIFAHPDAIPQCGIDGCINQPVGGFEEFLDLAPKNPGVLTPGLHLYWCRRHQFMLEARTLHKLGRHLSSQDVDSITGPA